MKLGKTHTIFHTCSTAGLYPERLDVYILGWPAATQGELLGVASRWWKISGVIGLQSLTQPKKLTHLTDLIIFSWSISKSFPDFWVFFGTIYCFHTAWSETYTPQQKVPSRIGGYLWHTTIIDKLVKHKDKKTWYNPFIASFNPFNPLLYSIPISGANYYQVV